MSRRALILAACLWIGGSVINAGFINANFRAQHPRLLDSERWARQQCGFALFISSLTPLAWVVTPFMTGFYYDGWSLNCHATHQ